MLQAQCIFLNGLRRESEDDACEIRQLRLEWLQGMSYTDIARKYQVDPRTAKRYVMLNLPISELGKRNKSKLDVWRREIELKLNENMSVAQICRELNAQGVCCAYTTINDYINKMRKRLI